MSVLLELECRGVKLLACDAAAVGEPPARLLVDLRKVNEIPADSLAGLEAAEVKRASIPVTLDTWSEQDVDALRREFNRGVSPVAVVSQGGRRAALLIVQHVARAQGWELDQALRESAAVAWNDRERQLLSDYLDRHRRDRLTNPLLVV